MPRAFCCEWWVWEGIMVILQLKGVTRGGLYSGWGTTTVLSLLFLNGLDHEDSIVILQMLADVTSIDWFS